MVGILVTRTEIMSTINRMNATVKLLQNASKVYIGPDDYVMYFEDHIFENLKDELKTSMMMYKELELLNNG